MMRAAAEPAKAEVAPVDSIDLRKEFEETLRLNDVECRMDPKWSLAPNQVSENRDTVV